MSTQALKVLVLAVLAVASLSACEAMDSILGKSKNPPDEFTVYQRAPLSIPPEFSLRPPEPGAPRPQNRSARGRAETALMGTASQRPANMTPGTQLLLEQAGAFDVEPQIRLAVNEETEKLAKDDQNITRKIMFWSKDGEYGQVIDAEAEAQRIKEGEAMGQSLNTIIRRK